jgi:competence protein ComEA
MISSINFKRLFTCIFILAFFVSVPMSISAATVENTAKSPAKTVSKTTSKPAATQLVNINTADIALLSSLPGIGPSIAERIVKYRKEKGAFKTPQDLGNVKGIGEKKLAKVLNRITVK